MSIAAIVAVLIGVVVSLILVLSLGVRPDRRRMAATGSAFGGVEGDVVFGSSSHGHDCGPGDSGAACHSGGGIDGGGAVGH